MSEHLQHRPSVATENRPLVSVMIPVYEPGRFLLQTLNSVLLQPKIGPNTIQIALLDDASPTVKVEEMLRNLPGVEHIEFYRNATNLGLAGNWNRAISLARGEYIHILHQDDVVLPGFYERLCAGLQHCPQAGMAFCRHAIVNETNRVERLSHRERWRAGILRDWLTRISRRTRIQCPAAIVRRSTYDIVGGFRDDLKFALDWEMWVRIAVRFPVWYEPHVLAHYRRHTANESARLARSGDQDPDVLKTIATFSASLPPTRRTKLTLSAYKYFASRRIRQAWKLLAANANDQARAVLNNAAVATEMLPRNWANWRLHRQLDKLRKAVPPAAS